MNINEISASCDLVLNAKAKEYSTPKERWHNFLSASKSRWFFPTLNHLHNPEHWVCAFAMKHYVSCIDIREGRLEAKPEMVREKAGDLVCYYLIWRCIRANLIEPNTHDWLVELWSDRTEPWIVGMDLLMELNK